MARLLDVAEVHRGDGQWMMGWEDRALGCAGQMWFNDPCAADGDIAIIGDPDAPRPPVTYKVQPFGIVATLEMPVNCYRLDDMAWLEKAVDQENELAVTSALVTEVLTGVEYQNWVGADGVTEVTGANLVAGTIDARQTWIKQVMGGDKGGQPIMHVSPWAAPDLMNGGIIQVAGNKGEAFSIYGDPVVIGDGYGQKPPVFFTGPLDIYISSVQNMEGPIINTKNNRASLLVNQMAAIDVAPCTIVRVGPLV